MGMESHSYGKKDTSSAFLYRRIVQVLTLNGWDCTMMMCLVRTPLWHHQHFGVGLRKTSRRLER